MNNHYILITLAQLIFFTLGYIFSLFIYHKIMAKFNNLNIKIAQGGYIAASIIYAISFITIFCIN
jgi:hypothetical protein